MAIETAPTRSRRALLTAGLGGLAALAANALGRPLPARAANGDPILAGTAETASLETRITSSATNSAAIAGVSSGGNYGVAGISGAGAIPAFPTKTGLFGYANQDSNARGAQGKSVLGTGVYGSSDSGRGVYGTSVSGTGVSAASTSGRGVYAQSAATDKTAMLGHSTGLSAGVQGVSGGGIPPTPEPETGVQGTSNASDLSNGVKGDSDTGVGVWGTSDTGFGVLGTGGIGLYGLGGYGVYAEGTDAGLYASAEGGCTTDPQGHVSCGIGVAIQVAGRAKFSRSGKAVIAAGTSSKKISAIAMYSDSLVLGTLQQNRAGVYVQAIVTDPADSSFTIYLNQSVGSNTTVGWFIAN
jgi:hypothetical protein